MGLPYNLVMNIPAKERMHTHEKGSFRYYSLRTGMLLFLVLSLLLTLFAFFS